MTVPRAVDAAAGDRVLVYGTPPPHGHDLDLLARPSDERRIARALRAAGFERRRTKWARFGADAVDVLDLTPVARWRLPPAEEADLFGKAMPLEPFRALVVPAPEHSLLVLARRLVDGGFLRARALGRAREAARAPGAWAAAHRRAGAWGAVRALALLQRACDGGPGPSRGERLMALSEQHRAAGDAPPLALARAAHAILRRQRGAVVALSGVDGSGKSTQAERLRASLRSLGYEAVVEWTRLAQDATLHRLGLVGKRMLVATGIARRAAPTGSWTRPQPGGERNAHVRITAVPWVFFVAIRAGLAQRRATRPHLRRGRLVVCDRYTLDSAVHLRYRYGRGARVTPAIALVRVLSPRPACTFLLDAPPELAAQRKPEHYLQEQLRFQTELYRHEGAHLGARRLDATLPPETLAAEIARTAWRAL